MILRTLEEADIPAARSFWAAIPGLSLSSADEPGALQSFLKRNPGLSWGAFEEARVVGTVLAAHDGRRGALYHLAVAEDQRGAGLSTQLMSRALDGLRAHGIERVNVFVLADNAIGLDFWDAAARRGWFKRDDVLVYSRDL